MIRKRRDIWWAIFWFVIFSTFLATPCLGDESGTGKEPKPRVRFSEVTSNDVTWVFDSEYRCGRFISGDWWVCPNEGEDQIVVIMVSPHPTYEEGKLWNGSMVNPILGNYQGYDQRGVAGTYFDPTLSVTFPLVLCPNQSLLSSVGRPSDDPPRANQVAAMINWRTVQILRTEILTCLSEPPTTTSFRPPYAGLEKPLFDARDLNFSLLPGLSPPNPVGSFSIPLIPGVNRATQYADILRGPWIEHCYGGGNSGQEVRPLLNCPYYYSSSFDVESEATLLLCLSTDNPLIGDDQYQADLLVAVVQRGIDSYYVWKSRPNPPERCGRCMSKWPTILAGIVLNNNELKTGHSIYSGTDPEEGSFSWFKTDACTYYGTGWNGATVLWRADKHYNEDPASEMNFEQKDPFLAPGVGNPEDHWCWVDRMGKNAWDHDGYRRAMHSVRWVGIALAAELMGGDAYWGHDAFFDYMNRWMTESEDTYWAALYTLANDPCGDGHNYRGSLYRQGTVPQSTFVRNMWFAYYTPPSK